MNKAVGINFSTTTTTSALVGLHEEEIKKQISTSGGVRKTDVRKTDGHKQEITQAKIKPLQNEIEGKNDGAIQNKKLNRGRGIFVIDKVTGAHNRIVAGKELNELKNMPPNELKNRLKDNPDLTQSLVRAVVKECEKSKAESILILVLDNFKAFGFKDFSELYVISSANDEQAKKYHQLNEAIIAFYLIVNGQIKIAEKAEKIVENQDVAYVNQVASEHRKNQLPKIKKKFLDEDEKCRLANSNLNAIAEHDEIVSRKIAENEVLNKERKNEELIIQALGSRFQHKLPAGETGVTGPSVHTVKLDLQKFQINLALNNLTVTGQQVVAADLDFSLLLAQLTKTLAATSKFVTAESLQEIDAILTALQELRQGAHLS
ncbi:hypothetical protein QS306_15725 [Paraburkholderia bonniea]|uniref:hypothetical protein n=1 Tax=Paraburkholderia bonniea TaxID=2152891 RepID=UPI00129148E3|nr:hypothetical protein [Paraburkholderia bonniea]WJF91538.1 hypothetical protein QS306_15725 [Paraburkholderia bonniea]WJF94857.1 hypothetical protein QS308_15730 [Paraburkholderia bonniea]